MLVVNKPVRKHSSCMSIQRFPPELIPFPPNPTLSLSPFPTRIPTVLPPSNPFPLIDTPHHSTSSSTHTFLHSTPPYTLPIPTFSPPETLLSLLSPTLSIPYLLPNHSLPPPFCMPSHLLPTPVPLLSFLTPPSQAIPYMVKDFQSQRAGIPTSLSFV